MCNFSKGIYNDGFEEGIKQGIQLGIEQGIQLGIEQGIKLGIEQRIKQGIEQVTIRNVSNVMKSLQIDIEKAMVLLELDENMKTICRENITC